LSIFSVKKDAIEAVSNVSRKCWGK